VEREEKRKGYDMIEKKFRAWSIEKQQYVYFGIMNVPRWVHPAEVEQSINLPNMRSDEIYEGDIIDCNLPHKNVFLPHRGVIIYDETFGSFATKNEAGTTLLCRLALHTVKKVGNIHENPELMGDK